jgi:hypothetical protein
VYSFLSRRSAAKTDAVHVDYFIGGGGAFAFFAVVQMPETAVDEDYFFVAGWLGLLFGLPGEV